MRTLHILNNGVVSNLIHPEVLPKGQRKHPGTSNYLPRLGETNGRSFLLIDMRILTLWLGSSHFMVQLVTETDLDTTIIIWLQFLDHYVQDIRWMEFVVKIKLFASFVKNGYVEDVESNVRLKTTESRKVCLVRECCSRRANQSRLSNAQKHCIV